MVSEAPTGQKWHVAAVGRFKDYNQLLKPNLSGMVVFSSVTGYLMAPDVVLRFGSAGLWQQIITLFIGGMLVTGGANTINQILEKDSDALMKRTRLRPMPDRRMGTVEAWIFAILTGLAGVAILTYYFNLSAGLLSFASLLLYSFAYTPMKKIHPVAVLIGAIPGALPPLIGWVAATGSFGLGGWVIFLLQFFWQFPHFWAIAWVAYDDYNNAGIRMLPTREKESRFTGLQCMVYSLILIPMSLMPRFAGLTGNAGVVVCILAGLMYFAASVVFYFKNDYKSARRVMFASFVYLPAILLTLLADKIQ
jgi:heme o synthase